MFNSNFYIYSQTIKGNIGYTDYPFFRHIVDRAYAFAFNSLWVIISPLN